MRNHGVDHHQHAALHKNYNLELAVSWNEGYNRAENKSSQNKVWIIEKGISIPNLNIEVHGLTSISELLRV